MTIQLNTQYVAIDEENFAISPRSILSDILTKKKYILCSVLNKGPESAEQAKMYLAHLAEGVPLHGFTFGMEPFLIAEDQFLHIFKRKNYS